MSDDADERGDEGAAERDGDDHERKAGDPFEEFSDVDTPAGDPFEELDDAPRGPGPGPAGDGSVDGEPEDPFEYAGGSGSADDPLAEPGAAAGESEPLADVDAPAGDPFGAPGNVFESADVGRADPDAVWERLTREGPTAEESEVAQVSKHSYCEGCPHFSAPPDVHCTHEGTEILEFVGIDDVRVVDCPVVAERRELEDGG